MGGTFLVYMTKCFVKKQKLYHMINTERVSPIKLT